MTKFVSSILTTLLVLLSITNIFADQLTLKNGDRISGKVIKQDAEKVVIETELAGILTISRKNIEKISLETAIAKEIPQSLVNENADVIEKKTESKGGSDAVNGDSTTVATKDKEDDATATSKAGRSATGFKDGWDGTANLGFSFTDGNAKTSLFTAGMRAEKSGLADKWTTYANMLLNRNTVGGVSVTASNAIWGGVRYDRNITKKVFAFGSFDFERDVPQKLNFRSVLGAGLGYHAIKNDNTELDFFGGAAWNNSWYVGPNSSTAELLVGNSLKHKFNDRVKVVQGFTVYPNLTHIGDYRFVFDTTMTADITKRIGWFVTVADRYNSLPLTGVLKNDFLFATGLKIGFGKKK